MHGGLFVPWTRALETTDPRPRDEHKLRLDWEHAVDSA